MVFFPPKPLHFSALFLYLDFSLLFSLFLTTFSSYSTRNVACYTRIGVSLSLLLTNPNIATTNTIPQLEEREKPYLSRWWAEGWFCTIMKDKQREGEGKREAYGCYMCPWQWSQLVLTNERCPVAFDQQGLNSLS